MKGDRVSAFAAVVVAFGHAVVPLFILRMDGAEPPATGFAVVAGFFVARFIQRRNALAGPFEGLGFCLRRLLRHRPSLWGFYAHARTRG